MLEKLQNRLKQIESALENMAHNLHYLTGAKDEVKAWIDHLMTPVAPQPEAAEQATQTPSAE